MPHLVFCGRYWRVAGDELSLPTICAVIGRIVWTVLLLVILSYTSHSSACSYGLTSYLAVSIVLFVSSILCEVSLIRISLQGSIVETHRRSGIGKILLLHIFLGTLECLCAVFGMVVISNRVRVPCAADALDTSHTDIILLSVVVVSQLVDITALACCAYVFAANKVGDASSAPLDEQWAHSTWEKRCRTICKSLQICTCNIFGGSNVAEDLEKVAKILTAFFHHEGFLDVVPSDVVAGILLVRMQQRAFDQRPETRSAGLGADGSSSSGGGGSGSGSIYSRLEEGEGDGLSPHSVSGVELLALSPTQRRAHSARAQRRPLSGPADAALLRDLSHYGVYAMSIYTHLMLLFVNPCSGVCQLCQSLYCRGGCCGGSASSSGRRRTGVRLSQHSIRGDSCCGVNEAAVAQFTKSYDAELVYAAFENSVHVKPYAIFLDHAKQKTVVTIRGTITLEDWISDGISDSVELKEAGELWGFDGQGRYGHEGFVTAALRIRQELEGNHSLMTLFSSGVSPGLPPTPNMTTPLNAESAPLSPLYPLVIVGHSLGAGVAVLLSLFLRKAYPDVRCYAFGCPGATVDEVTAREVESFVTTVVLGSDVVPRMSFRGLADLREQVLDGIARAKVNKAHIMQSIFREVDVDAFLYPPGLEPRSRFRCMVQTFTAQAQQRASRMQPLFLPGRIIHLSKGGGGVTGGGGVAGGLFGAWPCCRPRRYQPFETSRVAFSELRVSPTMLVDHFVDRYVAELAKIAQGLGP